jgi:hypothetical protein
VASRNDVNLSLGRTKVGSDFASKSDLSTESNPEISSALSPTKLGPMASISGKSIFTRVSA